MSTTTNLPLTHRFGKYFSFVPTGPNRPSVCQQSLFITSLESSYLLQQENPDSSHLTVFLRLSLPGEGSLLKGDFLLKLGNKTLRTWWSEERGGLKWARVKCFPLRPLPEIQFCVLANQY